MSFFNYQPHQPPGQNPTQETPNQAPSVKIPLNQVSDDPEVSMGRWDIIKNGIVMPLNYNPQTGEIIPWE